MVIIIIEAAVINTALDIGMHRAPAIVGHRVIGNKEAMDGIGEREGGTDKRGSPKQVMYSAESMARRAMLSALSGGMSRRDMPPDSRIANKAYKRATQEKLHSSTTAGSIKNGQYKPSVIERWFTDR